MKTITLAQAQAVVSGALAFAREKKFKPLGVAVLDVRGALVAYAAEDGATLGRAHVATGKASGCIMMGLGSRSIAKRGRDMPQFTAALGQVFPLGLVPVPGGVLIRSGDDVVGAVGISGDISDNDEAAALAGITAAGLTGDPGEN
jgi:uncharacterized protein GlcG (DUF336 family)